MGISLNKILITGAFGYLGSRLSKYFTKCGYNVTGLSRSVPSNYESRAPIMEEIIIGDDCSNDSTATVVKKYAKKYPNFIHAITRENNLVAEANFRDCIDHSRSEIIAVCEGDDYWTDVEKLAKQYKFMVANPDYSFIFS